MLRFWDLRDLIDLDLILVWWDGVVCLLFAWTSLMRFEGKLLYLSRIYRETDGAGVEPSKALSNKISICKRQCYAHIST